MSLVVYEEDIRLISSLFEKSNLLNATFVVITIA